MESKGIQENSVVPGDGVGFGDSIIPVPTTASQVTSVSPTETNVNYNNAQYNQSINYNQSQQRSSLSIQPPNPSSIPQPTSINVPQAYPIPSPRNLTYGQVRYLQESNSPLMQTWFSGMVQPVEIGNLPSQVNSQPTKIDYTSTITNVTQLSLGNINQTNIPQPVRLDSLPREGQLPRARFINSIVLEKDL